MSGPDFAKLDPRFTLVSNGGVTVLALSGAAVVTVPAAAAGAADKAPAGEGKGKKAKPAAEAAPAAAVLGPDGKPLSKKDLRILERQKREAGSKAAAASGPDSNFGEAPLIVSKFISDRTWTRLEDLGRALVGKRVLVRARLHGSRLQGNGCFLTLRQTFRTVQAVLFKSDSISKEMVKFAGAIPKESFVDVLGTLTAAPTPIESTTQKDVELQVEQLFVVSKAAPELPFQLSDACRPDVPGASSNGDKEEEAPSGTVSSFTRLNYRWIDLRTPANQAIMRISSAVSNIFRDFLLTRDFVEIQTPKILGGTSEGGSAVFRLKYFGTDACMAQSPQLYKQMCAACSDFERVFEIGPVFRAENSLTHRHLTEFHGLDLEMAINEHYYEVLDLFSDLFIHIFDELNKNYRPEIEAVRAQYPFEDLKYHRPTFRITFAEGVQLLHEAGIDVDPKGDLDTPSEKALGKIVKEKYGTDFFFMDKYPLAVRPFYTMVDPVDPELSNSYDFFLRGEEIVSGAQRVHDVDMLASRAEAAGIPVRTIQGYVDAFRHGALPHGGGGVGLERVVMLFLGLDNIRKSTMFTRDPKRLFP